MAGKDRFELSPGHKGRKQNTAIRSRQNRQQRMASDENYARLMRKLTASEHFQDEVYRSALRAILNRIESQTKDISQEKMLKYVRKLFKMSENKHEEQLNRIASINTSNQCVLKVLVERAENLASKDVDGSSDPYCLLSIVNTSPFQLFKSNKLDAIKQTRVVESSLNPEWNESFEIEVSRDQINDRFLQLQIWDYDETTKKIKGVKGVGRYVTEMAQSVASKKDKGDFMGFNSIPLTNITGEGLETWFKLRSTGAFQKVTGRIKLKLSLTARNSKPEKTSTNAYGDDIIYAGLLREVAKEAYNGYEVDSSASKPSTWNGNLSDPGRILIREFEQQHNLHTLTSAIMRWEVYQELHVQGESGLDNIFLENLFMDLERNSKYSLTSHSNSTLSIGSLYYSFSSFIQHECKKIEDHREIFASNQDNFIINLGSLLLLFKKLKGMGIYQMVRTVSAATGILPDVKDAVLDALQDGTETFYVKTRNQLMQQFAEEDEEEERPEEEEEKFGGREVQFLIKFVEKLNKDMKVAKTAYHGVFQKTINVDYMAVAGRVVEKNLSRDVEHTMGQVNPTIDVIKDPNHVDSERKSSSLFNLYIKMKDITNTILPKNSDQSGHQENKRPNRHVPPNVTNVDSPSTPKDLVRYYDWFRPALLRWLQMSRGRTQALLKKAVELDEVKRLDDIVKHSSSAVDTIGCLTGVVQFWGQLQWPDPVDAFTIALRLTDDMANAVEAYADLIHNKLRSVGFFDDEGQFDVTEELCVALNNLQYVKSFLESLPTKMKFEEMATVVDQHPEGPSYERVMDTFNSLLKTAEIGMKKKIDTVTAVVGSKMKPDILKYLRQFAEEVKKEKGRIDFYRNSDSNARKQLEKKADTAIRALMSYLNNNIVGFHKWLCEPNFRRILENLWRESVAGLKRVALVEYVEERPYFFYQCRHILDHHISDFFHADEAGISKQAIKSSHQRSSLESQLKMRCARTQDLIRLFYMQMFEEQQDLQSNTKYGYLNVKAYYDQAKGGISLEVINANNLTALDVNGLSDPFVQISLAPKMLFHNQSTQQTLVQKKTLDPLFEETFTFSVDRSLAELEGIVLYFSVLDHDIISSNDLEGEAVLPLNLLHGISKNETKNPVNFKLPLTLPTPSARSPNAHWKDGGRDSIFSRLQINDYDLDYESSLDVSSLMLLEGRMRFDKDADAFCRFRRKQENAVEEDKIVK